MPQVTNSYLGEDFFNAPKGLSLIQYNKGVQKLLSKVGNYKH